MTSQNNQSQMPLQDLLTEIVKQNNLLIQQIQVQTAQINELLMLIEDQEEGADSPKYLDD